MNPFQNTNIQVTKVEAKMASTGNMKYILTAQDNKKYYFYQKAKGQDSQVFQAFTNMQVKQGDTIAIGFSEEQKSFVGKEGTPINYTDRFIGSMREANGVPIQTAALPPKTALQPKYEPIEAKDEKFWDKKAYKQCLWGYWLQKYAEKAFEGRLADGTLGQAEMDLVWQVFNQIEQDATKRFTEKTGWDKAVEIFGGDEPPPEEPNF